MVTVNYVANQMIRDLTAVKDEDDLTRVMMVHYCTWYGGFPKDVRDELDEIENKLKKSSVELVEKEKNKE